jgi:hypothetical protein
MSAAEPGVAADRRPVAANLETSHTSCMAVHPRHVARSPRSPAHPAGAAPLSPGRAPAAERRVVRRRWTTVTAEDCEHLVGEFAC